MTDGESYSKAAPLTLMFGQDVLGRVHRLGEAGAFVQLFTTEPAASAEPELIEQRLDRTAARAYLGERISAGFDGYALFACIEYDESGVFGLRAEGFDIQQKVSVAVWMPMKRTLFGKLKPLKTQFEIDDFPSIPGVFTPKAGQ